MKKALLALALLLLPCVARAQPVDSAGRPITSCFLPAGDTDIGNVDLEFAGTAAATNNGTANAQTQRFTLASDSTGSLTCKVSQSGTENDVDANVTGFPDNEPVAQGTPAAGTSPWPTKAGNVAVTTAAWTSATGDETTLVLTVTGYSVVVVSLNATSTMTGGVIEFEGKDSGSIWFARACVRSGLTTVDTSFTLAVVDHMWQCNTAGLDDFRIRLSTVISGTGTANLRLQASAAGPPPLTVVAGSVSGVGNFSTIGTKSNNGSTPGTTNLGVLPAVALAAAPTQTEGNQVALRTQLDGDLVVVMEDASPVDVNSFPDNEPINAAQRGGVAVVAGACERESLLYIQIDQTSGEQLIAGTSSERIYICSFQIVTASAQNIALVDGTGSVCATGATGLLGGATAATGWNFGANGGIVLPPTRDSWTKTSTDADNVCLLQSGAGQVSGSLTYISIPNI